MWVQGPTTLLGFSPITLPTWPGGALYVFAEFQQFEGCSCSFAPRQLLGSLRTSHPLFPLALGSGSCSPCSQSVVLQIPHLLGPEAGSGTLPSPRRSVRLLEQQCRPCSRSRECSLPLSMAAMCGILLVLPSCTQNCWVLVGVPTALLWQFC